MYYKEDHPPSLPLRITHNGRIKLREKYETVRVYLKHRIVWVNWHMGTSFYNLRYVATVAHRSRLPAVRVYLPANEKERV